MDRVLNDPGELIRFWLWYQRRGTPWHFNVGALAASLSVKSATVSAWMKRNAIPTNHWTAIARHFKLDNYRQMEDEARVLWADPANRRGFTPLYKHHVRRRRKQTDRDPTPRHLPEVRAPKNGVGHTRPSTSN